MDQRALGQLAERAAHLAELADAPALDDLVLRAAHQHGHAPSEVLNLIAGEWARTGVTPGPILVPRGTHMPERVLHA